MNSLSVRRSSFAILFVLSSILSLVWQGASAQLSSVTIYLQPVSATNGSPIYDACFVLVGASNEGCDENGDGYIRFQDIAPGTYTVRQTRDAAGYLTMGDVSITANAATAEQVFPISLRPAGSSSNTSGGLVHVALVTRDPGNGDLVTGTCYIIQGASIEGCDENGDGQVDFADVTPGTYTVQQTATPNAYPAVQPFDIVITDDPTQAFIVKQAARQNDASHRNLSIVLVDKTTGQRVTGGNACVRVVDASNIGCDENGDGQVDFLDIPVGSHTVRITDMPPGYHGEYSSYTLNVDASEYSIVTVYLPLIHD
ncbi:MAG: SpaA isopeptide-forming pilin-related protein [Thermomicrobiales bacterium]